VNLACPFVVETTSRAQYPALMNAIRSDNCGLSAELVAQIVGTVLSYSDPDRIILFGSRSRSDHDERSDIDLAMDGVSHVGLIRGYLEDEVRTLRTFDVVDLNAVPPSVRESIRKEGVVLYEKVEESSREF
jgi:predicted nucleotidyltransferase